MYVSSHKFRECLPHSAFVLLMSMCCVPESRDSRRHVQGRGRVSRGGDPGHGCWGIEGDGASAGRRNGPLPSPPPGSRLACPHYHQCLPRLHQEPARQRRGEELRSSCTHHNFEPRQYRFVARGCQIMLLGTVVRKDFFFRSFQNLILYS